MIIERGFRQNLSFICRQISLLSAVCERSADSRRELDNPK